MDEDCFAIPDNSRDASVASAAMTAMTATTAANAAIDTCIFKSTHYDIANVIHIYLKDIHRYTENNTWEYLKTDATTKKQSWEIDVDNKELIFSIRTTVCNAFTARSLYWANAKDADYSGDRDSYSKYLDTEIISVKLLNISSKLKDNKYICVVIKECKQFFI
jgi:hypothetical protein